MTYRPDKNRHWRKNLKRGVLEGKLRQWTGVQTSISWQIWHIIFLICVHMNNQKWVKWSETMIQKSHPGGSGVCFFLGDHHRAPETFQFKAHLPAYVCVLVGLWIYQWPDFFFEKKKPNQTNKPWVKLSELWRWKEQGGGCPPNTQPHIWRPSRSIYGPLTDM